MRKYKEILVIPDSHAKPGVSNDRFGYAGQFVVQRQPDYVIDIGDSADMPSLSKYDYGTKAAEGRRYRDDIHAYHDAMQKFFEPIHKYNATFTRHKKKQYSPEFIKTRGNHENRITRAASEDPKYYGHIDIQDLREESYGWDVRPFLEPALVEGIAFQHYFTSGILGRAIGGDNHAASLVKKNHMSSVSGHSHLRDFWETTDAVGRKRFGLVVGCYFSHNEEWTNDNHRYWRGLVYLHDVHNGSAEPEFLNLDTYLKKRYG